MSRTVRNLSNTLQCARDSQAMHCNESSSASAKSVECTANSASSSPKTVPEDKQSCSSEAATQGTFRSRQTTAQCTNNQAQLWQSSTPSMHSPCSLAESTLQAWYACQPPSTPTMMVLQKVCITCRQTGQMVFSGSLRGRHRMDIVCTPPCGAGLVRKDLGLMHLAIVLDSANADAFAMAGPTWGPPLPAAGPP